MGNRICTYWFFPFSSFGVKKKKSIIPKIFSSKRDERGGSDEDIFKSDDGGIDLGIFLSPSLSIRVGHALQFRVFFFNII